MAKIVSQIAKSHLDETHAKLSDITKKVLGDVQDMISGITEKDIHDIIAGKYNDKKYTKGELQAQWEDLRKEAELLNKYEDILLGVAKTEEQKVEKNKQLTE